MWTGRSDGESPDVLRWHQVIQCIDLEKASPPVLTGPHQGIALIGFCSDEGVRRNQGRTGSINGSRFIREACRNLPLHGAHLILVDAGDVVCTRGDLEQAQAMLGEKVEKLVKAHYLPIVLGGGHEVAYGNFLGLSGCIGSLGPGVMNFDAHFDLRTIDPEVGATSGTGFAQMHDWCHKQDLPFHYVVMGIQACANTLRLFERANEIGTHYLLAEDFLQPTLDAFMKKVNGVIGNTDVLQVSIDLDVFAAGYAPGVSAPAFNGIAPDKLFKQVLRHLLLSGKVASIDIAECNPRFDIDNRTARLAASIIFDIANAADLNAEYPG